MRSTASRSTRRIKPSRCSVASPVAACLAMPDAFLGAPVFRRMWLRDIYRLCGLARAPNLSNLPILSCLAVDPPLRSEEGVRDMPGGAAAHLG